MEKELFFTGYCRCLDCARMVEVIVTDGELTEIDCDFPNCPHRPVCPIAQQVEEAVK